MLSAAPSASDRPSPWRQALRARLGVDGDRQPVEAKLGPSLGRALLVFAHPDDEVNTAGLVCRLRAAGVRVDLLVLTDGAANPWTDAAVVGGRSHFECRAGELRAAAALLGVEEVVLAALPDGQLAGRLPEAVARVSAELTAREPGLVVTFDPRGINGHPDHMAAHQAVRRALADVGAAPAVGKAGESGARATPVGAAPSAGEAGESGAATPVGAAPSAGEAGESGAAASVGAAPPAGEAGESGAATSAGAVPTAGEASEPGAARSTPGTGRTPAPPWPGPALALITPPPPFCWALGTGFRSSHAPTIATLTLSPLERETKASVFDAHRSQWRTLRLLTGGLPPRAFFSLFPREWYVWLDADEARRWARDEVTS